MNIIIFFANNPIRPSGIIALDLFNELKKKGHEVRLIVNQYDPEYPNGIISMETSFSYLKKELINKIKRRLTFLKGTNTDPKYHFHDLNEQKQYYSTNKILKAAKIKPERIIILIAKDFINSKNFYELYSKTGAPIYWLMFDMAPLTGGCHYAWDCKGYQKNCGKCPGLFSSNPFDITFQNLNYKKKYLDKTNIHVVTASEWQYRQTKESSLFKNGSIHKILSSFNSEIFKPEEKNYVRQKLGIPKGKKVIFFGAYRLYDERKGMEFLLDSFRILKDKLGVNENFKNEILLLIAGNGFEKIKEVLPFKYHNLGMLANNDGIASAYQAADIFVCPSIEDSGPSMINQSIMCGTPVVCFEMGVALDLVFNGKTGYRARLKDSEDFARGIFNILNMPDSEYNLLSKNCRQLALELYQPSVNIHNWLQVLNKSNC